MKRGHGKRLKPPAIPVPSYGLLRSLQKGSVVYIKGGAKYQAMVKSIGWRAGGKFTTQSLLLVDPLGEWTIPVSFVTCLEPCRPYKLNRAQSRTAT